MAKSSQNIILKRITAVIELLLSGYDRENIVQYCSDNWAIGERQSDTYIRKGKLLIEQSVKRNVSYDYAKAIRRYEELYRQSIESKDRKTAAQINKELATLQGLYKIQIEHSGNVQFICSLPE